MHEQTPNRRRPTLLQTLSRPVMRMVPGTLRHTRTAGWWVGCAITAGALLGACASDPANEVTAETYRAQLVAVCVEAAAAQALVVEPTEVAQVPAFARQVAALLTDEADRARALVAPSELDADHRAFVQNTADQAARWTSLANTAADDAAAFGELRTEILQLTLGRDDLATEMGVETCRRSEP